MPQVVTPTCQSLDEVSTSAVLAALQTLANQGMPDYCPFCRRGQDSGNDLIDSIYRISDECVAADSQTSVETYARTLSIGRESGHSQVF